MFNNMENRDLIFKEENNKNNKDKKKSWIWIVLYIFIILILLFAVYITSKHFLNATIKPNEMIVPGNNEEDDDDNNNNTSNDSNENNNTNNNTSDKNDNIFSEMFNNDTSKLKVIFTEQEDTKIRMYYTYPISEEKALQSENIIKFSLENQKGDANYKISLRDIEDQTIEEAYNNKRISHQYLNYYLRNLNTNQEYRGKVSDLDILESYICSGTIKKNETINFSIAVWVDENAGNDVQDSFYIGKLFVSVEGE